MEQVRNDSIVCSVIIPYYYKKREILLLLDSLEIQNYKEFEIIIINDGSDDIEAYVKEKQKSLNIKYYFFERTKESGRAFARNQGINMAKGDILIFLDCDQVVKSNFVEKHVSSFLKNNGDILQFGTRIKLLEEIETIEECAYVPYISDIRNQLIQNDSFDKQSINCLWQLVYSHNMSIRKSSIHKYGNFESGFEGWGLEDTEIAYRMYKNNVSILYNPEIEVYSLYESEKIDERQRCKEWKKNLELFQRKHPDLPVYLQDIFMNYYDIDRRIQLYKKGINNPWLYCYYVFERAIYLQEKLIE